MTDLAGMRAYVREYLDIEEDELSDNMVDSYFRDAYRRVLKREPHWTWLEKTWTLELTPSAGSYVLSEVAPDLQEIASIQVTTESRPRDLLWAGQTDAETTWGRGTAVAGTPQAYSRWGGSLYVWPTPAVAETISIRGYRKPVDWLSFGGGAVPDCPEDYHPLLQRWAIACEYERQDDTELAAYNRDHFNDELQTLWKADTVTPTAAPIIMGGNGRRFGGGVVGQPYPFD